MLFAGTRTCTKTTLEIKLRDASEHDFADAAYSKVPAKELESFFEASLNMSTLIGGYNKVLQKSEKSTLDASLNMVTPLPATTKLYKKQ